jgi:hypothetical protein
MPSPWAFYWIKLPNMKSSVYVWSQPTYINLKSRPKIQFILYLVDEIVAFICGCLTKKANTGRRTTSSSSYLTLSSSPLHLYLSSRIPPVLSSKAMCSSTFVSDYKLKMRGWWGWSGGGRLGHGGSSRSRPSPPLWSLRLSGVLIHRQKGLRERGMTWTSCSSPPGWPAAAGSGGG